MPPLGKDLFASLLTDADSPAWQSVPSEFHELFASGFEFGMKALLNAPDQKAFQFRRDLELAVFFSKFRPRLETNLYAALAAAIARGRKQGWSGAIATLNYERLLEESLTRNRLFPCVTGVEFYDDRLPILARHEKLELCYPHGACHFFLGMNPFDLSKGGNVVLEGKVIGGGVNHLLITEHVAEAAKQYCLPLICRYEPLKSPSVKHDFIGLQQQRFSDLVAQADRVLIIGVFCAHESDKHIWSPLAGSRATLYYFEPLPDPQRVFRTWATVCGKEEGRDFEIVPLSFRDAFKQIICVAQLVDAEV